MTDMKIRYLDYDKDDETDAPVLLLLKKDRIVVKSLMTHYIYGIRLYTGMTIIGTIRFTRDGNGKYQYLFTPNIFHRMMLKRGHLDKIQHVLKRLNDGKEV